MSFTIEHRKDKDLSVVRLQDNATNTIVDILPAYGALLHAFSIPVNGTPFNIVDNYADQADVARDLAISYKSSKLSPFVCRLNEGKYEFDGETYEIANKFGDGNAIHGLLYNKAFKVADEFSDDNQASVTLRYHYKREDPGYPFDYVCEVRYTLHTGSTLQVETTLINLDEEVIPVADGWHPYFQLGLPVNECFLQFRSDKMLEFTDKLIPTGKLLDEPAFRDGGLLGDRQLDNCFLLEIEEGAPCCVLHNPENLLTLSIYSNTRYPYLQLYTPPHRRSIAIENLSGAPDCFNNGMGLRTLQPASSEAFNVWYRLGIVENN
ncbi:MAG: aldose 1-epimerase [Chitinophagaceae bacterium]